MLQVNEKWDVRSSAAPSSPSLPPAPSPPKTRNLRSEHILLAQMALVFIAIVVVRPPFALRTATGDFARPKLNFAVAAGIAVASAAITVGLVASKRM